jgi:hypothetical protein
MLMLPPFCADQDRRSAVVYVPTAYRFPTADAEVADPSGATELVT